MLRATICVTLIMSSVLGCSEDLKENCASYKDKCGDDSWSYAKWLTTNCATTCCGSVSTDELRTYTTEKAGDKSDKCDTYTQYCGQDNAWMKVNCVETCDRIQKEKEAKEAAATAADTSDCTADKHASCASFKTKGYCEESSNYAKWMGTNCATTCCPKAKAGCEEKVVEKIVERIVEKIVEVERVVYVDTCKVAQPPAQAPGSVPAQSAEPQRQMEECPAQCTRVDECVIPEGQAQPTMEQVKTCFSATKKCMGTCADCSATCYSLDECSLVLDKEGAIVRPSQEQMQQCRESMRMCLFKCDNPGVEAPAALPSSIPAASPGAAPGSN